MNYKTWFGGAINAGLKQATKLALMVLTSYSIGIRLNLQQLALSTAIGFLWGLGEWVYNNPVPWHTETTIVNTDVNGMSTMSVTTTKQINPNEKTTN